MKIKALIKTRINELFGLTLCLLFLLCAFGCNPAYAGSNSKDTVKVSEEAAAAVQQLDDKTCKTLADYEQYCLDLLNGKQREAIDYRTLEAASEVYLRFYNGEVEVYENAEIIDKQWVLGDLIRTLPKDAFLVPEGTELTPGSDYYYSFYYDPDTVPERLADSGVVYRCFLGSDWALIAHHVAGYSDECVFVVSDSDWSAGTLTTLSGGYEIERIKSGAGRCGDSLFVCVSYSAVGEIDLMRSDDGGKTWQSSDITMPDAKYNFSINALSPVFDGERGILPTSAVIEGSMLFFITEDGGLTWKPME